MSNGTAHLAELLRDYDEVLNLIETSGLPTEQIHALDQQRVVLHDMIIEEVQRLGYTVRSRSEGLWRARQIV